MRWPMSVHPDRDFDASPKLNNKMKLKYGFAQFTATRLCIFASAVYLAMTTVPGKDMFAALIAMANALKITIDQLLDAIAEPNTTAAKEKRIQLKDQLVIQLRLL